MKYLFTISIALILSFVPATAQEITEHRLSDEVIVMEGRGGNMTVVETEAGLVVLDTFMTPASARKARKKIEAFSNKPIRYVINTHHHADHCFGNQVYSDAVIIGFKNFVERVQTRYGKDIIKAIKNQISELESKLDAAEAGSEDAKKIEGLLESSRQELDDFGDFVLTPPDLSLEGGATILLGGKTIKILHFGRGHTDTDLVIFVPEEGLLVMGDLLWNRRISYIDAVESDPLNWMRTLGELIKNCSSAKHVVPGHSHVSGIELLSTQRTYLENLWNAVKTARETGLTLEQAKQEIKLEQYKDYMYYDRGALQLSIENCWKIMERSSASN